MDSSSDKGVFEGAFMPLVIEQLANGQNVRNLSFRGVSMLPMLRQGKDTVDVSPLPAQLKKYDLPIYHGPNGKYLMHRIVGITDTHYICLGDNTMDFEKIAPEQMVAVVTAFTRNGKRISVDDPIYQLYCRLWRPTRPIRKFWRRAIGFLRRRLK